MGKTKEENDYELGQKDGLKSDALGGFVQGNTKGFQSSQYNAGYKWGIEHKHDSDKSDIIGGILSGAVNGYFPGSNAEKSNDGSLEKKVSEYPTEYKESPDGDTRYGDDAPTGVPTIISVSALVTLGVIALGIYGFIKLGDWAAKENQRMHAEYSQHAWGNSHFDQVLPPLK